MIPPMGGPKEGGREHAGEEEVFMKTNTTTYAYERFCAMESVMN